MKNKKTIYIIIAIILIIVAIGICIFLTNRENGFSKQNTTETEFVNIEAEYSLEDEDYSWRNDNVTYINLNDETNVKISKAGTYHLTGTMEDGSIIVDSQDKDTIKIVLENANVTSSNSSPINIKNADKVIILIEEGSINNLIDGSNYSNLDEEEEPNAVIFSKDDLIINGKGTLNITANYQDGIVSKDNLKILNAILNITAKDDGIRGKDSVTIKESNITIKANGDGIKSTEDTDTTKGYIIIEGGNYNIESEQDGIQAETVLKISEGEFNITTGGGSINSSSNSMGRWGPMEDKTNIQNMNSTTKDTTSCKALKGVSQIQILSGTFNINSSDDSIHSNGIIVIDEGNFEISSGDDGIHSDESLTINNATINISKSYEGIESSLITINNGTINIIANDDGINVAGGNDSSSINGRPGQNSFETNNNSNQSLNINGGEIYINATGDGLDSNGSINITDGNICVDGPTNNGNGALDYGGNCKITGGTLIAAGSSGMMQLPGNNSTQYSVSVVYTTTQTADTKVIIKDSNGSEIISYSPSKNFASIVICSPKLQKGGTYKIYSNETEISEFTINNILTNIGNAKGIMNSNENMQQPQEIETPKQKGQMMR